MQRVNKLLIVALALGTLFVVNYHSLKHPVGKAHGEGPANSASSSDAEKQAANANHDPHHASHAEPIGPVGSPNAKLKIKAFLQPDNHCHQGTIKVLKMIAKAMPQRIRVEFADSGTPQGQKEAAAAHIGCSAGLLIDGKQTFQVMRGGKKVPLMFHGPLHMMPPDSLKLVLIPELKNKYGDSLSDQEMQKLMAVFKNQAKIESGPGEGGPHPGGKGPIPFPGGKAGAA